MVIDFRVAAGLAVAREAFPNTPVAVLRPLVEQIVAVVDGVREDEADVVAAEHTTGPGAA